jgi:hypothetical protein
MAVYQVGDAVPSTWFSNDAPVGTVVSLTFNREVQAQESDTAVDGIVVDAVDFSSVITYEFEPAPTQQITVSPLKAVWMAYGSQVILVGSTTFSPRNP